MTSSTAEQHRTRKYLVLGAVVLCLLFLGIGWYAAEWTVSSRRLSLPAQLSEGMTRQQVEAILRAPIMDERKEGATGDVVVAYIVEYQGAFFYRNSGSIVDVRFGREDGKVKSVGLVDPRK